MSKQTLFTFPFTSNSVRVLRGHSKQSPFQFKADNHKYKALPIIADKRKQECDDVFGIAKRNPQFVLEPVTIEDTDHVLHDLLFHKLHLFRSNFEEIRALWQS